MTAARPPLLQPLRFPLGGNALIEASAGTGKTFTIAALYLRLVLGHGGAQGFGRPLTPPEILVVTFTEAATKELRDRIRGRLAEAARAFQADPAEVAPLATGQDLLHDLRAEYAPAQWRDCARRLQQAAEWMDEAAVSTIHGWCNRMLREHAFDSGSPFEQTLVTDERELLQEAVRDYWRSHCYGLGAPDAACVRGWWSGLEAFDRQVQALLPHVPQLPAGAPPAAAIAQAAAQRTAQLATIKAPWAAWADDLEAKLLDACEKRHLNVRSCNRGHIATLAKRLRAWALGDAVLPMEPDAAAWTRFTHAGIAEVWLHDAPFTHPALAALETLRDELALLPDGKDEILRHAAHEVKARTTRAMRRQAQMGFNDLLTQLHDALQRPGSGAELARRIRAQFPVALIDEFQDTDPVQYGIFRAVYATPAAQGTALVLIGDPKQAIYAFRGADIHTYLQARRDTAGRHYTLGTNFRSTEPMVRAVNHLFVQAEQRTGAGAFLFRTQDDDPLPFFAVAAAGQKERLEVAGVPQPALTCWWPDSDEETDESDYRAQMATACAAEIVRLLRLGEAVGFRRPDGTLRPLAPRDIAVLVNGRFGAQAVRRALAAGGVRSVYLSDRDNVYETAAAGELQRLLQACAAPEDAGLVRAALAAPLLALDWRTLDGLNHDEALWEQMAGRFRGYLQQWRRQGVLPMVRHLLHDFHVPQRLLAVRDERQLTDLLHLAELLQQASTGLQGEQALVRHLAEQREGGAASGDSRQVRLESDAELLKVVTVHKSKGLEYPLVFLPFPCACWPVTEKSVPLKFHDDQGRACVSLRPDAAQVRQADAERLGEDLRKLYVALTRAVHATWVGMAPTRLFARTAVGHLLQAATRAEVVRALQPGGAVVASPPAATNERYEAGEPSDWRPSGLLQPAAARERWWIGSYSRLLGGLEAGVVRRAPETAEEANFEDEAADGPGAPPALTASGTLHELPRGAAAGTFLHGLLEWVGRQGFGAAAAAPAETAAGVARRCQAPGWERHGPVLADWLGRWLATPLDLARAGIAATPVAPAQLAGYQVEMEFWIPAARVDVGQLDALVTRHTLAGAARPAVGSDQLNGMLKGFMDLVFEHEGRYYVCDYKSNRLGDDDAAYTATRMADEVLAKRYELQACLYLFALHRLLRARLGEAYDYDRHVGGALCLFLRGSAARTQGLHVERPPHALMQALDALFAGRGLEVQA